MFTILTFDSNITTMQIKTIFTIIIAFISGKQFQNQNYNFQHVQTVWIYCWLQLNTKESNSLLYGHKWEHAPPLSSKTDVKKTNNK